MKTIQTLLTERINTLLPLSFSMAFSILLLLLRYHINHPDFYRFMVWNLFLASIPFAISTYMSTRPKQSLLLFSIGFVAWLLFLPNAPYMVTDLMHLKYHRHSQSIWLDVLMLTSFAINGLVLYFLSLRDIKSLLLHYVSKPVAHCIVILLFPLTGFGIYLGRFLRFNSWDILQHPDRIFMNILKLVLDPVAHKDVWFFTACFGLFLGFIYYVFKAFKHPNHSTF